MRNRETIEFLGLWEELNNPDFKPVDFARFGKEAGRNYFVLTAKKWIKSTGAITSKRGRFFLASADAKGSFFASSSNNRGKGNFSI